MTRRTRKTSKQEKGITLIALIVTIIVLLILAGVTINLAVNNQGIFNKAKTATKAYKNATENERTGLDEADKEIAKYMPKEGSEGGSSSGSETTGNDPLKNTDRTIDDLNKDEGDSNKDGVVDTKDDLRGFYIDLNNNGNLDTTNDGVIYGDLLTGGKGVYWCATTEGMYDDIDSYLASLTDKTDDEKKTMKEGYNSATGIDKINLSWQYRIKSGIAEVEKYTIPTKSTLSTYEIIKDSNGNIKKFDGPFGSRGMLQRKTAVTNGDRFYVMALADFDSNSYYWYSKATNMTATYTSTSFGSGKENTSKMITAWNNKKYGEQTIVSSINGIYPNLTYKLASCIKISPTKRGYSDVWGVIQDKAKAGWFVPSRDEWNAFGAFFKVGGEDSKQGDDGNEHAFTDYYDYNKVYKLSNGCWSSSQYDANQAFGVRFLGGGSGNFYVDYGSGLFDSDLSVRLSLTF